MNEKRLLQERETLRFHCAACETEWVDQRPQNQWIRSGDGTNYYVLSDQEDGPHIPIICPKCLDPSKIRRIPPPLRPSTTESTREARRAMNKWATNPITTEEMLGETPEP